jgi:hypothetical protein
MTPSDPISGLDHVLVGVADLEAARLRWLDLGFTLTPRGRHIHWGTANYCIMFESDYIELLGIRDPTLFTNNLDNFLTERQGLLGLALATEDSDSCAQALRAAGISVDGPKALTRVLELESGEVEPAFSLVHLTKTDSASISAFICQHLTREMVWQKAWQSHPNGGIGLTGVTVVCDDPAAASDRLAKLPGSRRGITPDSVSFGAFEISFQTIEAASEVLNAGQARPDYRKPWLAALRIAVKDLAHTGHFFSERKIGRVMEDTKKNVLRLPATDASGVILEFQEVKI